MGRGDGVFAVEDNDDGRGHFEFCDQIYPNPRSRRGIIKSQSARLGVKWAEARRERAGSAKCVSLYAWESGIMVGLPVPNEVGVRLQRPVRNRDGSVCQLPVNGNIEL